jgi:hypothetical protein
VPASIAREDPARWAEYNRKFNDLIAGRAEKRAERKETRA